MKTSINSKFRVSVLYAIGLLAASTVFAQGHVNGPDTKGNSIPVIAEGEIPLEKLTTAANFCYKQAAGKILKMILGRDVDMQQLVAESGEQMSYNNPDLAWTTGVDDGDKPVYFLNSRGAFYSNTNPDIHTNRELIYRLGDAVSIPPRQDPKFYSYGLDVQYGKSSFYVSYSFWRSTPQGTESQMVAIKTAISAPTLHFRLTDRSTYDELGVLVRQEKFVSDIGFTRESEEVLRAFPLENSITKRAITPTLDYRAIINCVKYQLAQPSPAAQ